MDLSIVSGTYNRIAYLQKMVASVRSSIGNDHYGLQYEIVLVDGGSIDGTQRWCQEQSDIRLIQHTELLGAVKAFNDGAFAAQGVYVILANDDIEFLNDSIFLAWLYMEQHPDCGVGCFYQDRDRQHLSDEDSGKWNVEKMPVVESRLNQKTGRYVLTQSMAYYGQVCIVPKWLGDSVSWWCDKQEYLAAHQEQRNSKIKPLHTYAGDNELSSRVYDLGFKIEPVPGTKIHDGEAADDLRKINNISGAKDPRAVKVRNGHYHPDSYSWGRKWTDRNTQLCGAVLKDKPMVENPIQAKERILYLPIFEQGWPVLKEQKNGLREALAKHHLVVEYDYVERHAHAGKQVMMTELMNLVTKIRPTIILTQLHNGSNINADDIRVLRKAAGNAYFVNWNGDYWPENYLSEDGIELSRSFDLATSVSREAVEKYQRMGINARYWQVGFEPEGTGYEPEEYHDVVFLATGYSRERQKLGRWLTDNLNGYALGIYGQGWPKGIAKGENLYNFREACKVYRGAKISIGDSQWPQSGFVSNRVMQALAAGGSALAHQWFRGMEELGLTDGKTCIIWHNTDELKRKIAHYIANEPARKQIAEAGERLALERHSFDTRVKELFEMIRGRVAVAESEEDWR
jgi:glycosyltransferase involved in cell wall biosynthesis